MRSKSEDIFRVFASDRNKYELKLGVLIAKFKRTMLRVKCLFLDTKVFMCLINCLQSIGS